jgi:transcriptional regulator GlxA family with amidase domain
VNEDWQKLLPLLVHIQANLDGDLSLAALSQNAGLSPSHFHRLFKAAIGETPRDYVMRLRVERGAFRLLLHDARLVDVALDCGFQRPLRETQKSVDEDDAHGGACVGVQLPSSFEPIRPLRR